MKRFKTTYPGVFYREVRRRGKKGIEKVYYIVFKKEGKFHEEKVGRHFVDDMTPARAATIRGERIEGKRISRKDKRDRDRALKEAEKESWTVLRLWNLYFADRVLSKSLRTDESRFNLYIKPDFGDKEPKNIILLDVDRLRHKQLKNKSPQTQKHVLSLFLRIIKFGTSRNLCKILPFQIKLPEVNNTKIEDLTHDEIKRLLEVIEKDTHPQAGTIMKMALYTGMRKGELLKLKWQDVDAERGFIALRDPKGGQDQKIPLNDITRNLLDNYPKTESPFIFPGRGGKQRQDIKKPVNEIKKKAGLPKDFRPLHGLRHVFASMLASSGDVDMFVLQKLLTHKDGRMTQRYAHLRDETLKDASNLAGQILKSAMEPKKDKIVKIEKELK